MTTGELTILSVCAGAAIAVAGWIVAQWSARRGVRRQTRIDYLLRAYRQLEALSDRRLSPDEERELEAAVADIQLLGSAHQVELVMQFARQLAENRSANYEDLLEDLRASLRRELLLEPIPPERIVMRIHHD